jgi:flavin reductase (DIM6/NTAB) family NADH-FMN oxidoreductase RutF
MTQFDPSLINMVGVAPPMLMFSLTPREGQVKDTGRNIERLPEFVVHLVDEGVKEKMSEVDFAGFQTAPSVKGRPPRTDRFMMGRPEIPGAKATSG